MVSSSTQIIHIAIVDKQIAVMIVWSTIRMELQVSKFWHLCQLTLKPALLDLFTDSCCLHTQMASSSSTQRGPGSRGVKRKVLNLEDRVKVIKLKDEGLSCKKIADMMGVGKTQVI